MVLGDGDAYVYDLFTSPGWRGRGLAAAALGALQRRLWEIGRRRAVLIVAVENRAGFGPPRATGYRPIGEVVCVRYGFGQTCRSRAFGEERLPTLVERTGGGEGDRG